MTPDIRSALSPGPQPATQLRQTLDMSQPSLSRMLRSLRGEVAVLGRGRSTRYALYRQIRELPPEAPVHRISIKGEAERIGTVVTIAPDLFWYEDLEHPSASAAHASLHWFMTDMRPQGYLGRLFPQTYADLSLPSAVNDWNEDQAFYAVTRRGEDAVGNLIIGEESFARWIAGRTAIPLIHESARIERYAELADQAVSGRAAGSSAAGEQPKFTAAVGDTRSSQRHVIVKFSGRLSNAAGRRWSDLLLAEHIAGEVLRAHGHPSAHTEYLNDGRRAYLEVERFDRSGLHGRMGLISLGALDDEFVGERRGWSESAAALLRARLISMDDARELRFLSAFGVLIANSDMHLGNASFLAQGFMRFRLAPSYDMLPMAYAPLRDEVRTLEPMVFQPRAAYADQWSSALPVARAFWQRLAEDVRLTAEFAALARAHAALLAA